MKKMVSFLAALLLLAGSVIAKPVDVTTARRVATHFWNAHRDAGVAAVSTPLVQLTSPFDGFYIFANGKQGFVIVAADDCVEPILGYSFTSPATENINPEVRYWLSTYQQQIEVLRGEQYQAPAEVEQMWRQYDAEEAQDADPIPLTAVSPLLTTTWNQSPYYNALCPMDPAHSSRSVTGCVATATAQVMKYWNWPAQGNSAHAYVHDNIGLISAHFGSTVYDWGNMPNALNGTSSAAQVKAVATLMRHVGVALEMDYSASSSGAVTYYVGQILPYYFGYRSDNVFHYRDDESDAVWTNNITGELDALRPVIYAGSDTSGGHCFVCDGYNNNNQFHFNWGWGGYYDGYYSLSNLAPSSGGTGTNASSTFNLNQRIFTGIRPDTSYVPDPYYLPDPNCLISTFPYTENFDDTTHYGCLKAIDANSDGVVWGVADSIGVNYSKCAYIQYAVEADDYLVLPGIAVPGNYTISWKASIYNASYPETYEIYAGQDMIFTETLNSLSYVNRSASFTVSPGDTVQPMFRYISDDEYYFFIDDITIGESAPTVTIEGPATVMAGDAATFTATVTNSSNITWTLTGATPATASGASVTATWSAAGTYNVIATATNAAGTTSDTLVVHVISCSVINTFPYSLTFSANDADLLNCWTILDQDGDGYSWTTELPTGDNDAIGSASYINGAGVLTPDNWLISPQIQLASGGTYTLSWDVASLLNFDFAEHYGVYVSTSGAAPSNFTLLQQYTLTTNATTQVSLSLNAYAGQTIRIAFRHWNCTDQYWMTLDNIAIVQSSTPVQQYTLTVNSNNSAWGSVTGGGTYASGATATLTATAATGYHFVQWQDGNTDNPRTVTVTANATYTATFAADAGCPPVTTFPYSESFDASLGCWTAVDGNNDGYTWLLSSGISGGSTTIAPHSGAGMAASFSWNSGGAMNANEYLVSPQFVLPAGQTVTLSWWFRVNGSYPEDKLAVKVSTTGDAVSNFNTTLFDITPTSVHGDWTQQTVDLSAYAGQSIYLAFHHHDSYDANYLLVDDIQITATGSAPTQYTITVASNNSAWGTVTGGGTYASGATATLTATAATGYHFVQWQDGNTDNPRTITVTGNATYTATFAANDQPGDDDCVITTFPYTENFDGANVTCWDAYDIDNDADNTNYVNAWFFFSNVGFNNSDAPAVGNNNSNTSGDYLMSPIIVTPGTYVATWKAKAYQPAALYYYVMAFDWANMEAMDGYQFDSVTSDSWVDKSFTFTVAPGDSVRLAFDYVTYGGSFLIIDNVTIAPASAPQPTQYTLTVQSNNNAWGTVTGGGTYNEGTSVTLTATPATGYHFVKWQQDGNTQNPRTVTVTGNATYTAVFAQNVGIDEVAEAAWNLYPNPASSVVTIDGVKGQAEVTVTDINGRAVLTQKLTQTHTLDISHLSAGTYFVTVTTDADSAVRKLIVK